MPDEDSHLADHIRQRREERNREYKGASGAEGFSWGHSRVKAVIAKSAMAMANIGGGAIVVGMGEDKSNKTWRANGVAGDVADGFKQDDVQQYVNGRADPYVWLVVRDLSIDSRRFILIDVAGFDEIPVVCSRNGDNILFAGQVYTRPFAKHATAAIDTQSEMRELLDRAIDIGIRKRLRSIIEGFRVAVIGTEPTAAQRFSEQRGNF